MMSFERVRKNINGTYTNEFIESLIKHFPSEVRRAKLKGSKPGIAILVDANVAEEA